MHVCVPLNEVFSTFSNVLRSLKKQTQSQNKNRVTIGTFVVNKRVRFNYERLCC